MRPIALLEAAREEADVHRSPGSLADGGGERNGLRAPQKERGAIRWADGSVLAKRMRLVKRREGEEASTRLGHFGRWRLRVPPRQHFVLVKDPERHRQLQRVLGAASSLSPAAKRRETSQRDAFDERKKTSSGQQRTYT